ICDGWALGNLLRELGESYSSERAQVRLQVGAPVQFREYLRRLSAADGDVGRRTREYWKNEFREPFARLELPTDRPRPAQRTYRGSQFTFEIDASLTGALERAGAKQGCTLFATLLSAYSLLLQRFSGQHDVVVAFAAAAHSLVGAGDMIGHTINFLPLRIRI